MALKRSAVRSRYPPYNPKTKTPRESLSAFLFFINYKLMDTEVLRACLKEYQPFNATEKAHTERTMAFLEATPEPFSRTTKPGHVTGSAVVWAKQSNVLLLLWHVKLERWLQPGGHCEPLLDADTLATAWRELLEETEAEKTVFSLVSEVPFDVDVHEIPARGAEPAHFHYDIRYLFTLEGAIPTTVRAVPLTEVAGFSDASLARLALKLARLALKLLAQ